MTSSSMGCILMAAMVILCNSAMGAEVKVRQLEDDSRPGFVEIRGVSAGAFDPEMWQKGRLNILPDVRVPFLEPLPGKFRNIYAPSAVELPGGGWRVFYGAWDGTDSGNDRIYSVTTNDFLSFADRHTVIEHGSFIHVCNVNAIRLPNGAYTLACTAYPVGDNTNKPALFHSPDGKVWNGDPAPHPASEKDLVRVQGYPGFDEGDFNGMNVILYEDGKYRLWFGNFKDFGSTYRATSTDGKSFRFDGKSLDGQYAVNDVKKFRVGSESWYLMGLHWNQARMWYALSQDGMSFQPAQVLAKNLSQADRYIVAHGWVVSGEQEQEGRRLLGYLYGAGADSGLAENRLFARWLQKKVIFVTEDGERISGTRALGPDRQLLPVSSPVRGRFHIYAEDGRTLLGVSPQMSVSPGRSYTADIGR